MVFWESPKNQIFKNPSREYPESSPDNMYSEQTKIIENNCWATSKNMFVCLFFRNG